MMKVYTDSLNRLVVSCPYTPDFVAASRKLNGKWYAPNRVWLFDPRDEERVRAAMVSIYGTDGSFVPETTTAATRASASRKRLSPRRPPMQRNYHLMFREGSTALYYTFPGSQAHHVMLDSADGTGVNASPALVWCVEALAQARQALLAYKTAERLEDIALSNPPPVPGSADDWRRWNEQRTEAANLAAGWLDTYGDI